MHTGFQVPSWRRRSNSLVWHYRAADAEVAPVRARELVDDLVSYTANIDVQVLREKDR